ncbi:transposase [Candidatus Poribacteria bacterium]|nr:transposase [Candidatus Poribacteria bacterium]
MKHLSYIFRMPTSLTQLNYRAMVQIPSSKKGDGIGYSGHKHQKGEKEVAITDNNGYPICPITIKAVNKHDCTILPQALTELIPITPRIGLDLNGSVLTLDSGFDTKANHEIIKEQGLLPVIDPNRRNAKEPIVIARKFRWFRKEIYKDRYKWNALSVGTRYLPKTRS